ncbi:MAG: DUF4369 domain-containing protein, partial [Ferruginibacter sp.]|nr:DUF4369 domain-containing protein [Ferruginibacter sp.]
MNKQLILWALCLLLHYSASAKAMPLFEVRGNIPGIDSGTIELLRIRANDYYNGFQIKKITVPLRSGKFQFNGSIEYPHIFYAKVSTKESVKIIDLFFIDRGVQVLDINFKAQMAYNELPLQGSLTNTEYNAVYKPLMKYTDSVLNVFSMEGQTLYQKYGSQPPENEKKKVRLLMEIYRNSLDSVIYPYIKKYPSSYVGLWRLVERFSVRGYTPLFDSAVRMLNANLKKTSVGQFLIISI